MLVVCTFSVHDSSRFCKNSSNLIFWSESHYISLIVFPTVFYVDKEENKISRQFLMHLLMPDHPNEGRYEHFYSLTAEIAKVKILSSHEYLVFLFYIFFTSCEKGMNIIYLYRFSSFKSEFTSSTFPPFIQKYLAVLTVR